MLEEYNNDEKIAARAWLFNLYMKVFGYVIPLDRQYWFLCNKQTRTNSESAQIVASGLATAEQLRGVDNNEEFILGNRLCWPEAEWFYGMWDMVLSTNLSAFNPALVYLDTTSTAISSALVSMTVNTMHRCPFNTMLCVNVMLNNPAYSNDRWNSEDFIHNLGEKLSQKERDIWFNRDYEYYCYMGRSTVMAQYVFTSRVG
ncbi:hypothetical protein LCGC14_0244430 [marine sediment metagenome]|uniref:Uncharacterized protein n=1 Tax=marine sediment metagenome TaxID=412755 RepID=A0A0F9WRI5_9ZZZZ